jgi:hypothetical protein
VTRVGATATKTILDDFRSRQAGACPSNPAAPTIAAGAAETGY